MVAINRYLLQLELFTIHRDLLQLEMFTIHRDLLQLELLTIHRDLLQLELFTIHRDLQLEIVAIHRDLLLVEMLAMHRDLLQLKMLAIHRDLLLKSVKLVSGPLEFLQLATAAKMVIFVPEPLGYQWPWCYHYFILHFHSSSQIDHHCRCQGNISLHIQRSSLWLMKLKKNKPIELQLHLKELYI